jgi:hypothetical protein
MCDSGGVAGGGAGSCRCIAGAHAITQHSQPHKPRTIKQHARVDVGSVVKVKSRHQVKQVDVEQRERVRRTAGSKWSHYNLVAHVLRARTCMCLPQPLANTPLLLRIWERSRCDRSANPPYNPTCCLVDECRQQSYQNNRLAPCKNQFKLRFSCAALKSNSQRCKITVNSSGKKSDPCTVNIGCSISEFDPTGARFITRYQPAGSVTHA